MALNNQRDKRSKEIALALRIFATGSMQAFAQPTNVDMSNRLICFNIQSLGEQLKPVAMLSMLEYINTAVMSNERNDPKAATWVYFDEIYLLLRDSLSANFLYTSWKRFRKYNAYATGITQNMQDCLTNDPPMPCWQTPNLWSCCAEPRTLTAWWSCTACPSRSGNICCWPNPVRVSSRWATALSHSTTPNPRILRLTNYSRLNPVKWSESYE